MKVSRMIKMLQDMPPDAEVKLHHPEGNNALFVLQIINRPEFEKVVFIEDKSDNDMCEELGCRFDQALEDGVDELDFFMDLIEIGITLDNIKEFVPDKYEYAKYFMEEHGLI